MTHAGGVPIPSWSSSASQTVLDETGISCAVLSVSSPGVEPFPLDKQLVFAARLNEGVAEECRRSAGRFRFFGSFPVRPIQGRTRAVADALDKLGASGVVALSSSGGHRFGDSGDEELLAELDRRACIVFIHPHVDEKTGQPENLPTSSLEFVFETTRTAANLILRGVLEHYPRIRFVLAHSGGTLPYVALRLAMAHNLDPSTNASFPRGVLAYVQRFYFETALSTDSLVLQHLTGLVGSERVLFGTDYPFTPTQVVKMERTDIDNVSEHLIPGLRSAIVTNGEGLFGGGGVPIPNEPIILSSLDRILLRIIRRMLGR